MAEGSGGDSSPQDRRPQQIGGDRSSSSRASSGSEQRDKSPGNNEKDSLPK